ALFNMYCHSLTKLQLVSSVVVDSSGWCTASGSLFSRAKEAIGEKDASPSDFLKHLKDPVAGTRSAIRAADYMETTLSLLKKKLRRLVKGKFNITDVLSRKQKEIISKATGCDYQIRSIKCPKSSIYRTITGECNNRKHSYLGASNHGYARWLPAEYEDGVSLPKGLTEGKLYNGFPLPLVRDSNENVTQDQERSLIFMQWGQWVDHDLDLAPFTTTKIDNKEVHCETSCTFEPPCFPIQIPPDDPRIKDPNTCMPFVRTAPVCNARTFTREQINAITSFLDASMVYGSEVPLAKSIRNQTNQLGLMALNQNFTDAGLGLLPFENKSQSLCLFTNKAMNIPCFKAGKSLSQIHKSFPHHNQMSASTAPVIALSWSLFIITYRDYLPLLLGDETEKEIPCYTGYDESEDPTVANVFSLAFRFGHSSIQPFVNRLDEHFQPLGPHSQVPLHLTFCASWRVVMEGGIDPLLRGLLVDHAKLMKQNQMVVEELQERLFEQVEIIGLDLAALNLQRGRDHGLPGYNAWRQFCGLSQPRNLAELSEVLRNPELARKFMDLYGTPDNIDIWIGAMAEPFVPNGRVGPLLACIIGSQFRKLRDGDRFWWENPGVFTPQQRQALSSSSLPRVLCDNTRIREVPRDVFKVNRYPEDFVNCRMIDSIDLSPWRQRSN
uniref:Eosinophil peroxidase n=1 Tax=Chrysemys picta bellii TaxID=8478 RepID=A0A8C3HS39_CHRPI